MKYLCFFISFIYIVLKTKKYLQILQQNWYDDDHRYFKWILENKKKVFITTEIIFICLLFLILKSELFTFIIGILYYSLCIILDKKKKTQNKLPLKLTKRVKRLIVTIGIFYFIPSILLCVHENNTINYLFLSILIYFNPLVLMVANICNIPIEKMVGRYYKKKAMSKLKEMKNLKVIGITGSYGKTSSKNILYDVLDIKFNVFKTPKNYNTPNGMMLSINNYLDKFNDYFIAEMGAFQKGEIKELCDMMHPTYGILTKIGTAHLESFGSRENIRDGKFELIESLPEDGIGILNKDDEMQVSYHLKNNCKIKWIGIDREDVDVRAINIKLSPNGTTFDCIFKGDSKTYHFETKLLGKANIYNILAAIALGKELSLSIDQLIQGVKKVMPVEHRLELKKMGTVNIIDDAYNSNPVGSKMALEVLDLMPGKKIIVTPGMIEMGEEQDEINRNFGRQIAEVCDEVILIGEMQTKPIYEGLKEKKYKEEHIHILNDVRMAFPLIQKLKEGETYALLENDLPDIFNEK